MKKKTIPVLLLLCAALLTTGFTVRLIFDYILHYQYGSAPFALYVIERFAEYMLPASGCFIAGMILRKKMKRGDEND